MVDLVGFIFIHCLFLNMELYRLWNVQWIHVILAINVFLNQHLTTSVFPFAHLPAPARRFSTYFTSVSFLPINQADSWPRSRKEDSSMVCPAHYFGHIWWRQWSCWNLAQEWCLLPQSDENIISWPNGDAKIVFKKCSNSEYPFGELGAYEIRRNTNKKGQRMFRLEFCHCKRSLTGNMAVRYLSDVLQRNGTSRTELAITVSLGRQSTTTATCTRCRSKSRLRASAIWKSALADG